METTLEFAKGPLFRLTFAVMVLGLTRILVLDVWAMIEAYRKAGDKKIPWRLVIERTLEWIFPLRRVINSRPIYSIISIIFHIGLLIVPLFLIAHIHAWERGLGICWRALPKGWADFLTLTTIVCGILLFIGRVAYSRSRMISRMQDYLWPLLLAVPFVTGYVCSNMDINASIYRALLLTHILAGEVIFVFIPFTKIAHCTLMILSQMVMTIAWKFPARVDEDICETLGKRGAGV